MNRLFGDPLASAPLGSRDWGLTVANDKCRKRCFGSDRGKYPLGTAERTRPGSLDELFPTRIDSDVRRAVEAIAEAYPFGVHAPLDKIRLLDWSPADGMWIMRLDVQCFSIP